MKMAQAVTALNFDARQLRRDGTASVISDLVLTFNDVQVDQPRRAIYVTYLVQNT